MRRSGWLMLVSLSFLLLAACGASSSSSSSSGDWFYHWNCNGDSECLATNPSGTASGTLDEGPVEVNCTQIMQFGSNFWGAAATQSCDQNSNGSGGGGGSAPTISGFSPASTAPGNTLTITGTDFPTGATVTIDGLGCTVTSVTSTRIVCTLPAMGNFTGTFTVTTSGGNVTSSSSLTVVNHFYGVTSSGNQSVAVGGNGTVDGSTDGITWRSINPTPEALYAIAWSGTLFTTVGQAGTIITTSSNGGTWQPLVSGISSDLFGVAWSATLPLMVAVGRNGTIVTSPNGVTWTSRVSHTTTTLAAVAWCGAQFIVVGNAGVILTSPDGVTWTAQISGTTNFLNAVACSGSLIVVGEGNDATNGGILTSTTGTSWSPVAVSTTNAIFGVVWSGTQFLAVGLNGTVYTSPTGANLSWTLRTTPTTDSLNAVTWSAARSQFVAVGGFGTILTSPDGISWTARTP